MNKEKIKFCYSARIDRVSVSSYSRVAIGSITIHFQAENIKDAYQFALKKGEEVFGKETFDGKKDGEYNAAQVSSTAGIRNEDWKM